jgi:L-amino acid N-acyltransferase YncA
MDITFRAMTATDWTSVAEIYKQGIETGNATFQQAIPAWEDWNNGHVSTCRIVVEVDNEVAGWAALSAVSSRPVYAGVAEVSVYVGSKYRGLQLGTKLLDKMITESESQGFWTLQAGIFPENKASIAIHKKSGFREIGYREKVAKMNTIWRNTVLMERRSTVAGME